jgi:hypothetical protein
MRALPVSEADDPLAPCVTPEQQRAVQAMLRGKHAPDTIAATLGLRLWQVQTVARMAAPMKKRAFPVARRRF